MNQNQRMVVAAIADRLIYGDETTFQRQDAEELLALLPAPSAWKQAMGALPQVQVRGDIPSAGMAGYSPGHGPVRIGDTTTKLDMDTHGRLTLRVGQWRIYRAWKPFGCRVRIEQVATDEMLSASVVYRLGRPVKMTRMQMRDINLGLVSMGVATPQFWKSPAD